eukprot:TRINITY_DN15223_c0_g1_i1.p1 TRINITY_DN15223_c0_g1~~TRINITY_DN15223_c0_g1_i1.p1  ORF type:complete len:219 (+),score=35.84 TRINITY_DN15223_c0_g1_i1:36-692(+)
MLIMSAPMASGLPASVPCKVRTLSGKQYSVNVQSTWRIRELRQCVHKKLGIPEYEQSYVQGSISMRSGDLLFQPELPLSAAPLEVVLVRSRKPSCFSKSKASDMWRVFIALSDDHGDTARGDCARQIARFEGMSELADAIANQTDVPERFTFLELLRFLSMLEAQLPRTAHRGGARREQDPIDVFDFGNTTCPRMPATDSEAETDGETSADSESENDD